MARRSARGRPWRRLRAAAFERAGHVCERCGRAPASEVHHTTAIADGGARLPALGDVEALCQACHLGAHGKRRGGLSPEWSAAIAALEQERPRRLSRWRG